LFAHQLQLVLLDKH